MKKLKLFALSAVFASSTIYSTASPAIVVNVDEQAAWAGASGITSGIASVAANSSNNSASPTRVPTAFWLVGSAMVFLFRKRQIR